MGAGQTGYTLAPCMALLLQTGIWGQRLSHTGKLDRLQTERDIVLVLRDAPRAYADVEAALERRYCCIVRSLLSAMPGPPSNPEALLREFVTAKIKDQSTAVRILDPVINGDRPFWLQISHHLRVFLDAKLRSDDVAEAFCAATSDDRDAPENGLPERACDTEVARILRDAPEAYDRFVQLLQSWQGYVGGLLRSYKIEPAWDADAILNDFLTKALTPESAEKIFGPVVEGKCSLKTMVFRCLRNRVIDIWRRPPVGTIENIDVEASEERGEKGVVDATATEKTGETDFRLGQMLRERVCVLQEAKTWLGEYRAPYYQSLLLSERTQLANQVGGALEDGALSAAYAEQWVPWVVADGELVFEVGKPTLDETWMRLRALVEQGKPIRSTDIAAVLDIASNRFDQWVSRARHKVVESVLGEDWATTQELFPHW